jgi:DHA1 family multidrug resistance protein-like MFS transporter
VTTAPLSHPDWRRNQFAVTIATFIGFTGFTLVMPFLPLYFQQLGVKEPGAIAIWSGFSLGVTPAVTAWMTPVWARLALRVGHKLMVQRSLFSFVIIMAMMAFVTQPWQVFALRTLQGFFAGYGPIAMMLAAESSPSEHMATAIGWVQTSQRLGPAIGPVIGGALAHTVGLRGAFLVSAVFYLFGFALVAIGYRERPRERGAAPAAAVHVSWRTLRPRPNFVLFVGTIFTLQLVDRSFGPVLPLYLSEIGMRASRIPMMTGVIFTIAAATGAAGNQFIARLLVWRPLRVLVPLSALLAAAASVVFGLGPSDLALLATAVVFGLGIGVATTAVYTEAGQAVSSGERSVVFGYLQMAYLIGLAVSPVLAGLIGSISMRAVFFADAVGLAMLAAVVRNRVLESAHA